MNENAILLLNLQNGEKILLKRAISQAKKLVAISKKDNTVVENNY